MSDERPLNIRVAEALGLRWEHGYLGTRWRHVIDGHAHLHPEKEPQRFDTDWSATGPLLVKYDISIIRDLSGEGWHAVLRARVAAFDVSGSAQWDEIDDGPTPLLAACNLLLSLHAAGKLPEG